LNPIEQIWKELRKRGFKNELFQILDKVVDRLCDIICALSAESIKASLVVNGFYLSINCILV